MPGRKCSVFNCENNSIRNKKDGIQKSFYRFPKDENQRKKWALACNKEIPNFVTALVCADHFKENDYINNTQALRPKRLKAFAVPTLNLGSGILPPKKLTNKNLNKENSNLQKKESIDAKGVTPKRSAKKKSSINASVKETVTKKKSVLTSDKENANEPLKNKIVLKKISTSNMNSNSCKEVVKKKRSVISHEEKTKLKKVDIAGNSKEDTNRENDLEKTSVKRTSKFLQSIKNHQALNGKTPKIVFRNKGKSKKVAKLKNSSGNDDRLPTQKITADSEEDGASYHVVSFQDNDQSLRNPAVRSINGKVLKRKETIKNGNSKKKRIRLGKDDSDDEEWSNVTENGMIQDKVTFKSCSEMVHNADLLKYLNYLKEKEKSRNSDQPILFLADK